MNTKDATIEMATNLLKERNVKGRIGGGGTYSTREYTS